MRRSLHNRADHLGALCDSLDVAGLIERSAGPPRRLRTKTIFRATVSKSNVPIKCIQESSHPDNFFLIT
jgi:hypothetical protein